MTEEIKNQTQSAESQVQLIQAKQAADFALTRVGQMVKQFEATQRIAKGFATSTIVPDTYRNNFGNSMIAADIALRMDLPFLMIAQNLYVVHGMPAFSSKFLIACINDSGRFSPLRYQFRGTPGTDEFACRCVAYEAADKEHKEPLEGDWISLGMAKKEGWSTKPGSKWKTMPEQMMRYRAAAFWQRVYCPEISMGFISKEEADEIQEVPYEEVGSIAGANQGAPIGITMPQDEPKPDKTKAQAQQREPESKPEPAKAAQPEAQAPVQPTIEF